MYMGMTRMIGTCLFSAASIGAGWGADGVTLRVVNRCSFPIWPAVAPNGSHPVVADGGFFLPPGQSRRVQAPSTWSGRLWARTGCKFDHPSWRRRPCRTGDCQRRLACNGTTGEIPATLVEMTLQPGGGSHYDVSLVDGYNLPVSISATPDEPGCYIGGCVRSPNAACPPELQVRDGAGRGVVACKSACRAFDRDDYCCRNAYGSEGTCKPTAYSTMFKDACPHYFSYAFDTPSPLVRCSSHLYIITFCPPIWGTNMPM
uniref:Thaumatin-like protein n=1 Tax=Anthurium amnicola TaxID=1678845 RepID=A0A1D1XFL7_9ARAE